MRLAPGRNFARGLALTLAAALSAAACAPGGVTTTAGPTVTVTGTPPPPGTVILADLNGEGAAEGLGKVISVTPETTTTTTTAPPIIVPTAPRPVITTAPTTPPQPTQTVPTPTQTVPQPLPGGGKPPPFPISISALSGDEQAILNNINTWRSGRGLSPLIPEQKALAAARTHSARMAAAGSPTPIPDILNAVDAQYSQLTSVGLSRPALGESIDQNATYITTNHPNVAGLPFAYAGVGVTISGNLRWITLIVGS